MNRRWHLGLRAVLSVLLVAMLGLETLPWGIVEHAAAPGEARSSAPCREPLPACDPEESVLGILFELPVLATGAPRLLPSTGSLPVLHQTVVFLSDGFRPAVDRPPRRLA